MVKFLLLHFTKFKEASKYRVIKAETLEEANKFRKGL